MPDRMTMAEKAELALRLVREAKVIAYDTETSGLDWKRNSVVGYVVTAGVDENVYVPVRHGGGGNLADPACGPLRTVEDNPVEHAFEKALAAAFVERQQKQYKTVGHHTKFDAHMSARHGIFLGPYLEDTQLNESLLNEYAGSYSLEACAKRHGVTPKLGQELYDHLAKSFGGQADRKAMENFWQTAGNDAVVIDYSCGDGITTLKLQQAQAAKLAEEDLTQIAGIENDLIWTLFRMEHRGIKIDTNRVEEVRAEIARRLEIARMQLPGEFNVRSSKDVRAVMEAAGHTSWPLTAKGNPNFNEKWLRGTKEGQSIIAVRKLTNLQNTFLEPLLQKHIYKGRVHSTLNQMKMDDFGTISGRFSCSDPNQQQAPKHNKDIGKLFRSIFVPDEGFEYFEADYSQCEPRLFAHYAKEAFLLDGYNRTPARDMHAVVAEELNVPRQTAKTMNMGLLNGMQLKTFAGHMGWTLEETKPHFDKWNQTFPGIASFRERARQILAQRGFVRTLLGRKCRLDNPSFAYKAVSKIIQGSNADIVKIKLLEADRFLRENGLDTEIQFLMTIHDSFEGQNRPAAREIRKDVIKEMAAVQKPPFDLRVPFEMETGVGQNWAQATYGAE